MKQSTFLMVLIAYSFDFLRNGCLKECGFSLRFNKSCKTQPGTSERWS